MRSLLNSMSTLEIVLVFVCGAATLAVVCVLLVERWYPGFRQGSFDEGSKAIETTFTLLFGLILALTIAGLALNSDTASSAVTEEATAMAQLTRVSRASTAMRACALKASIDQYVHAVATDEFATMKEGRQSPLAATALANLYAVLPGPLRPQAEREPRATMTRWKSSTSSSGSAARAFSSPSRACRRCCESCSSSARSSS